MKTTTNEVGCERADERQTAPELQQLQTIRRLHGKGRGLLGEQCCGRRRLDGPIKQGYFHFQNCSNCNDRRLSGRAWRTVRRRVDGPTETMTLRNVQSTGGLGSPPLGTPSARSSTASLSSMAAATSGGASVENSVFTFPTPQRSNQRRPRDGRRRPPPRKTKDIQREYQLLQSQTLLLVGTASLSFVIFLLFTLPLGALIGLTVMVSSLGACLLVASAAVKTRYQLEMLHPMGLVRYLPEKIRAHLTEMSLHECLSPSGSMESLTSLKRIASKESLSTCNSSSKGSIASMAQQNRLELGSRQRYHRGMRKA